MSYAGPVTPDARPRPSIRRLPVTNDRERTIAFAAGIALGAALGAGVALLLAPNAGRVTRRNIARAGRSMTDRGRDAWSDLRHELRREFRRALRRRQEQRSHADYRSSFSSRDASSL